MDIDKRLEGLTMNVELLTRDIHDLQGIVRELASYIKDVAVGTARLANSVRIHDERLDGHDERIERLEGQ
jgi:hypothetical protein